MPSYAILGATGNVGQAILTVLLQSPDNQIHAYCRSKQKLLDLSPQSAKSDQVRIFEGNLDETEVLTDCLRNTRAVFLAIAPPGNQPGCTIVQDAARHTVQALQQLKSEKERLPKIILVSSASTDHSLMQQVPSFLRNTLYRAFSNTYDDLKAAETYLQSQEDLVSATFAKPGALSNDTQKGHVLSLENCQSPLSYLDLAAGMIEIADEGSDRYEMKGVAINSTAKDVAFPWEAPMKISRGLISHFFPWLYPYVG